MNLFIRTITVICLLLLPVFAASGQVADFTASPTAGCAPLVVNFTNTSTGATSYFWDLGNTTTTAVTNPSTSYLTPGTYTVKLTAYNGSSSSVKTIVITVYPNPTPIFAANDTVVCPGVPVTFTSTSISGVPGATTCYWNYGDGNSGTGNPITHTYTAPGNYNVTLSVTNAQGCVASLTRTTYIDVFPKPTANFGATPANGCTVPHNVTFTNTTTGSGPMTYAWAFGDGGTSTLGGPTHSYGSFGSYTVKLVVTDANGCMDSITRSSYINITNISASFTGPTSGCIGAPLLFTSTSGAGLSCSWDFGDGGTGSGTAAGHVYTAAGTYSVRLIVSNGYCNDTIVHTVTIAPSPLSSYTITPPEPCPAPSTRTFNASVAPGSTVTWIYGDGATGTGASTTHTYTSNGIDTIKLVVTSPSGCRDSITRVDTIFDLIPLIIDTPNTGCKPLTVHFSAFAYTSIPGGIIRYYPYGISSYTWNFGDGSPASTTPAPAHVYTAVGVYTITCTIITANGCPATDTAIVYVGEPPTVTFTATPTRICAHDAVTFTSSHTGTVTAYQWDFGDGTSSSDTFGYTVHEYHIPGVYSPTLTAYYNGCPSDPFVFHNITVDSPTASFTVTYLCNPRTRAQFTNTSLGATNWLWQFGDGFTNSTTFSPTHDYPALTTYTVTLTTHNVASGCRDTVSQVIDFSRPTPDFVASDTTVCQADLVTFTPLVTGGSANSVNWYDNGILVGTTVGLATFTRQFNVTGWHTIRAIMTDSHGCFDTVTKTNYVLVAKPNGNFTAAPTTVCAYTPVTFTDGSTAVPGSSITTYMWDFGDGASSSVTTPVTAHTYTAAGLYTVTEMLLDNIGCRDTVVRPSYIQVNKPTAAFWPSSTHPCKNVLVNFNNTSTGGASFSWTFGDGGTSTATSPSHTYTANGTYNVKLVVVDAAGCSDTMTQPLVVSGPVASFAMSDSVAICPPLFVTFTNTSTGGATSYLWTFGDGNSSTLPSPSDMYIASGSYTVTLVVTDVFGCSDTARRGAHIFGSVGGFSYTPLTGCAPLTVFFTANVTNVPSIIWDFADGTISPPSTSTTTSHIYTIPGAYVPRLVLSDGTGCQSSSPGVDTIKVNAVSVGFTLPPGMCEYATFILTDTTKSYWSTVNSWFWNFNGVTSTDQSPTFTAGAAGVYTVSFTATDAWGCTGTVVREVTIHQPPEVDAGADTVVCFGDYATLLATGANTYVWADGATLSCTACNPTQATPPAPQTYTVVGTDIHGCTNTDTIRIYHRFKTESEGFGGGEICSGTSIPLFDTGATKFTWYPPNWLSDPTSGNPIATPLGSLTYTVIAQLAGCIPDTNTISIIVHPTPEVDAGPNQTLATGTIAHLQAVGSNVDHYIWTDASTLSCDTCAATDATPDVTTTYTVTVTNNFGCRDADTVTVYLYCDNNQIFVPNTFTPNGDGQNDVFFPRGAGVKNLKSFRIYNRWGQLLFERNDIPINDESNAWDGSYGGSSPRPDVYVYVIEGVCGNGKPMFIKGDVTIIR